MRLSADAGVANTGSPMGREPIRLKRGTPGRCVDPLLSAIKVDRQPDRRRKEALAEFVVPQFLAALRVKANEMPAHGAEIKALTVADRKLGPRQQFVELPRDFDCDAAVGLVQLNSRSDRVFCSATTMPVCCTRATALTSPLRHSWLQSCVPWSGRRHRRSFRIQNERPTKRTDRRETTGCHRCVSCCAVAASERGFGFSVLFDHD